MVKGLVEEAINEYNKFHGSESVAKLLTLNETEFTLEFTGSYCYTCGFYDYFEDYQILLEDRGVKSTIVNIEETDAGAVVNFKISK